MKPTLELDDIQSLILYAHKHLQAARFFFLRVDGSRRAVKAWLATLSEVISTASAKLERPTHAYHVGFTASGLRALGLPDETLKTFLLEFREGMANPERARSLGDVYQSDPKQWDFGGPTPQTQVDLVLMLYASDEPALNDLAAPVTRNLSAASLHIVAQVDTQLRADGREPFGFVDGIAQPSVEGMPPRPGSKCADPAAVSSTEPVVSAGEFILGYRNAYGALPFSPRVDASSDPDGLLNPLEDPPELKDLGRNGSYLVIRKLEQDTQAFRTFLNENARDLKTGQPDPTRVEWLAAKLMGRWKSGAPVTLDRERDNSDRANDDLQKNNFDYREDKAGLGCPIGAHIRRANPRASLDVDTPEQSLGLVSRHRIVRRGRPYREMRPDAKGVNQVTEGILFLALNTNIARQFEFIQQTWVNNPSFGGQHCVRDPIAGANYQTGDKEPRESYAATIPAEPYRIRMTGISRFVHTRGGAYLFLPGKKALRFLSTANYESKGEPVGPAANGASSAFASPKYQDISTLEK